jgi:hypothetical protein
VEVSKWLRAGGGDLLIRIKFNWSQCKKSSVRTCFVWSWWLTDRRTSTVKLTLHSTPILNCNKGLWSFRKLIRVIISDSSAAVCYVLCSNRIRTVHPADLWPDSFYGGWSHHKGYKYKRQRNTQKRANIFIPRWKFEPVIPVFERSKTVCTLNNTNTLASCINLPHCDVN